MQGGNCEQLVRPTFLDGLQSQLAAFWQHLGFWPGSRLVHMLRCSDDVQVAEGEQLVRPAFLDGLQSRLAAFWQHLGFWPDSNNSQGQAQGQPGKLLCSYLQSGHLPDAVQLAGVP